MCSWRRRRSSNCSTSVTRKGDCCETKGVFARDGCDFSARRITLNPTYSIPTFQRGCRSNPLRVPSGPSSRSRRCYSDEGDVKRESSGFGRPSRGTAKTRWPEHMFGVPRTHHPHLARGTTVMKRRGHCRTP